MDQRKYDRSVMPEDLAAGTSEREEYKNWKYYKPKGNNLVLKVRISKVRYHNHQGRG